MEISIAWDWFKASLTIWVSISFQSGHFSNLHCSNMLWYALWDPSEVKQLFFVLLRGINFAASFISHKIHIPTFHLSPGTSYPFLKNFMNASHGLFCRVSFHLRRSFGRSSDSVLMSQNMILFLIKCFILFVTNALSGLWVTAQFAVCFKLWLIVRPHRH